MRSLFFAFSLFFSAFAFGTGPEALPPEEAQIVAYDYAITLPADVLELVDGNLQDELTVVDQIPGGYLFFLYDKSGDCVLSIVVSFSGKIDESRTDKSWMCH